MWWILVRKGSILCGKNRRLSRREMNMRAVVLLVNGRF